MASDAPPSLPPIDAVLCCPASIKDIPNPSTDFLCIIEGIIKISASFKKADFKLKLIFFLKITIFSNFNSLTNFFKLLSSSPYPIQIYFILGYISFRFLIVIITFS